MAFVFILYFFYIFIIYVRFFKCAVRVISLRAIFQKFFFRLNFASNFRRNLNGARRVKMDAFERCASSGCWRWKQLRKIQRFSSDEYVSPSSNFLPPRHFPKRLQSGLAKSFSPALSVRRVRVYGCVNVCACLHRRKPCPTPIADDNKLCLENFVAPCWKIRLEVSGYIFFPR